MALWPSGLRRAFQVRILIGVGSNPINVIMQYFVTPEGRSYHWMLAV
jgi:hypothetical protein